MIEVKVIADSLSANGDRITTLQLEYPRFIHGEFMTHRVFSRNSASSRAIPVAKMISQVWNDPAMPGYWGANQAGMQAKTELQGWRKTWSERLWKLQGKANCLFAWLFIKLGLHKQLANRGLEAWQNMKVVVTSTEWDNFFELRCHPDAQPEMQALANEMMKRLSASTPIPREYHLPYVSEAEVRELWAKGVPSTVYGLMRELGPLSAARCARVSYLKHDGSQPKAEDDLKLFARLVGSQPIHASPTEHQALAARHGGSFHRNLRGWIPFRALIEQEQSDD